MLRPVSDPVAVETPSRRLRVASMYRSFNTSGSIESLPPERRAPLTGRGHPLEPAASAVKRLHGRGR